MPSEDCGEVSLNMTQAKDELLLTEDFSNDEDTEDESDEVGGEALPHSHITILTLCVSRSSWACSWLS